MLIDTHAHLTWDSYKTDLDQVIQRSLDAGVKTVINIGADLKSSQEAAKLDCAPLTSYFTVGLHPHEVSHFHPRGGSTEINNYLSKLEEIYHLYPQKVVAIGECGLDYHFEGNPDFSPTNLSLSELKALQLKLFQAQIELAKKMNLPLIIHCRDSWQDIFLPGLKGTRGVFHSFTGDQKQAQQVLDFGFYLGFTCVVTYPKNDYLRQIIKTTPLDRILTETDCPFLPPQNKRGQRNEPANVVGVVKTIAQIKNLTLEQVARVTTDNAKQLFGFLTNTR